MTIVWWRVLTRLALLAVAALVAGLALGAAWGWGAFALLLAVLYIRDQRYLHLLGQWSLDEERGTPPLASGGWDDMFAILYRQSRDNARQQASLVDALQRLRRAAQALPDGVVMLNDINQIQWCNAQAEDHFNIRLDVDGGQNISNLLRSPDFMAYLAQGQWEQPVMLRLRNTANSDRLFSVQLVLYGDDQRLLLSRDVTNIERLETMRRDFVANVSHELKTPLTVLSGFLETIREMKLPARQQEHFLSLMSEQAERMERLVADLLTLSALEANSVPPDEPIDMTELLERVEATARGLSSTRHELEFRIERGLDLLGAESEIASALTNLVTNAIRYTPEGGSIVVVWESALLPEGRVARFVVTDSGIGIPAQHLSRLTERFYRVDRGRSRESGGTGLGLAIVKHALTRHQARLEVSSTVGKGSTFTAIFPQRRIVEKSPLIGREHSRAA